MPKSEKGDNLQRKMPKSEKGDNLVKYESSFSDFGILRCKATLRTKYMENQLPKVNQVIYSSDTIYEPK